MANEKVPTSVRFDEDVMLKIAFIAKKKRRSINGQMEYLAECCIAEYEKEHGPIPVDENLRGLR